MDLERFHAAFVKAQEQANKSDVEVAALLGVSENTVARWRVGLGKPRKPTVLALKAVLPEFAKIVDSLEAA